MVRGTSAAYPRLQPDPPVGAFYFANAGDGGPVNLVSLGVAIATPLTDDLSNRILQLWPASSSRHIRPDSGLCLSLHRLPASNWKCLRSSGSLPVNLSHNQWHLQGVRPRRRRRNPDLFQVLP